MFEEICRLPEYYITRTEISIIQQEIDEIIGAIAPRSFLIEYGSGNSLKTRLLLGHAQDLAGYIPIDISSTQLFKAALHLSNLYPGLKVYPVCADYTGQYVLPSFTDHRARRVVFSPGSTIGNFTPQQTTEFLRHIGMVCGPGGGLIIGVDLKKDPRLLNLAYNDSLNVTAAFNLNLLERINRELGADFKLDHFSHYAYYDPREGRIEMHLVSLVEQVVHLNGDDIHFDNGESIRTEYSYKYTIDDFKLLGAGAGFMHCRVWTDPAGLFSIHYLTVEG